MDIAREDAPVRAWWNVGWGAIWTGVIVALGLFVFLLLFGTALGLTAIDPYDITRKEMSNALPAATIAWIVISALASMFVGSWLAGILSRSNRDGTLMQSAIVWGLCILLTTALLAPFSRIMPRPSNDPTSATNLAYGYSSLNDERFANFILDRAKNWRPGNPEEPINVSADVTRRVNPDKVKNNDSLRRFVQANTNLTKEQTEQFLDSEKNTIAREQADAQRRWEREHAVELTRADRSRKAASAAAWTGTGVIFGTMLAALGGAYLGWSQRRKNKTFGWDEPEDGQTPASPLDPRRDEIPPAERTGDYPRVPAEPK